MRLLEFMEYFRIKINNSVFAITIGKVIAVQRQFETEQISIFYLLLISKFGNVQFLKKHDN